MFSHKKVSGKSKQEDNVSLTPVSAFSITMAAVNAFPVTANCSFSPWKMTRSSSISASKYIRTNPRNISLIPLHFFSCTWKKISNTEIWETYVLLSEECFKKDETFCSMLSSMSSALYHIHSRFLHILIPGFFMVYARLQIMLFWFSELCFNMLLKLNHCSDPAMGRKRKEKKRQKCWF